MAALKSTKLKTSLAAKAKENATVTRGTRGEQTELKRGVPAEHSRKHLDGETPVVGVSIGITKNMDNYESLRIYFSRDFISSAPYERISPEHLSTMKLKERND